MGDDFCCDSGRRQTKNDKRAKGRYNKYKHGGKNRAAEIKK